MCNAGFIWQEVALVRAADLDLQGMLQEDKIDPLVAMELQELRNQLAVLKQLTAGEAAAATAGEVAAAGTSNEAAATTASGTSVAATEDEAITMAEPPSHKSQEMLNIKNQHFAVQQWKTNMLEHRRAVRRSQVLRFKSLHNGFRMWCRKQAACRFWRTRTAVHRWKTEVFHIDSGFCLWAEHKHMALNELSWKKAYDWALLYVLFSGTGTSTDLKARRYIMTWSLNYYDVCVEVERVHKREAFLSAQYEQIAAADERMAIDQLNWRKSSDCRAKRDKGRARALLCELFSGVHVSANLKARRCLLTWSLNSHDAYTHGYYESSDDVASHKFDDSTIYHIYCRGSPQEYADYDGYNGGDNDWVEEYTGAYKRSWMI